MSTDFFKIFRTILYSLTIFIIVFSMLFVIQKTEKFNDEFKKDFSILTTMGSTQEIIDFLDNYKYLISKNSCNYK